MKRIKAACIYQTILFSQTEEHLEHDYAVKLVQDEVNRYKATLDRNGQNTKSSAKRRRKMALL